MHDLPGRSAEKCLSYIHATFGPFPPVEVIEDGEAGVSAMNSLAGAVSVYCVVQNVGPYGSSLLRRQGFLACQFSRA